MCTHRHFVIPAIGLFGLVCNVASAQTLIDNLHQPIRAATVLGTVDPDLIWAAQSFGSPSTVTLVSIDVIMGNAIDGCDAFAELRRGDDPTGPVIATFVVPPLSATSLEIVTLVSDVSTVIEPNVLYWLVVGTATTGSCEWAFAEGNDFVGKGFFGSYWYSFDFGATWVDFGGDNPYNLRVNVALGCSADFNADGLVNSQDFFDFLADFFSLQPGADFNQDAFINSQDFFDFLAVFFAGC